MLCFKLILPIISDPQENERQEETQAQNARSGGSITSPKSCELSYVMDQRMRQGGKGHMQMGKLDKKVTAEMQEALDLEESGDEYVDNEENNNPPVADE